MSVWIPLAAILLSGVVAKCPAQANFGEGFDSVGSTPSGQDGPQGLTAGGWIFRNQSTARVATSWRQGNVAQDSIGPNSGSGYLACGADWDAGNRAISTWAILPAIPNVRAGDTISYFVTGWSYNDNRIQLRYSPTGGTSTGSGTSDVGDFTQVVNDTGVDPFTFVGWIHVTAQVPGTGRLALRWYNPQVMQYQSPTVLVDTLTITGSPIDPPIPQPGQTVTWRLADSPIQIRANTTIPAGGTVLVEPGVTLNIGQQATLTVSGTLRALGAATQRIAINASAVFPPAITVQGGALELAFADIRGQLRPDAGGSLTVTDSAFIGPRGVIYSALYAATGFARLDRCTFTNSEFTISNYTVAIHDVTLTNSITRLTRDYAFISNLVCDGQPLWYYVEHPGQPTLIGDLTVRNVPVPSPGSGVGAGISISGGNFFIDPAVTIQNCQYPLEISNVSGAGVLAGSRLPAAGNVNNLIAVDGGDNGAPVEWADAGVPYLIQSFYSQHGGGLTIHPGVTMLMGPDTGMAGDPSPIQLRGTEARPITVQSSTPGARWYPLQNVYRFRHAILDGARTAAAWPSILGWGFMDSSVVRNCSLTGVTGQGVIRKTVFSNNAAAANVDFVDDLLGNTNPNLFEGNGLGVIGAATAAQNWWGSSTGPRTATNPGGTGDPVADGIPCQPFRTNRPDTADAPPVVDLKKHHFMAHPGEKLILSWDAQDDGRIVSQRVLLARDGDVIQQNLLDPLIVLAENLPGTQRSLEFTVTEPAVRFFGAGNIRVEATDDAGQVGWDDLHLYIERDEPGQLAITTPLAGPFTSGQRIGQLCWQPQGTDPVGGEVNAYLELENSGTYVSLGGASSALGCLSLDLFAPMASTDRARLVLSLFSGGGVSQPEYFYSEPFAVRPDARVGDAAPVVAMTSPAAGAAFTGGSIVPIAWTASDDDFVRSISIQASYDGGRTWNFIASDLPGSQTSLAWRLPPSSGIPGLRIKVIAADKRFQDASDQRSITVTAGTAPACVADVDANGLVEPADVAAFVNAWFTSLQNGSLAGDFDHSGAVEPADVAAFISAWLAAVATGC